MGNVVLGLDETNLGVSRVGVEDITEELARHGYACDNQSMDVV